tara:strand:- start:1013 stop:1546 length:534 start_codon:yes stop_codon:yes gene_type:complete
MDYILITPYPDGPKKGTIAKPVEGQESHLYFYKRQATDLNMFIRKETLVKYSNWAEYSPEILNINIGSFIIFRSVLNYRKSTAIYKVLESSIILGTSSVHLMKADNTAPPKKWNVATLNVLFKKGTIIEFETIIEAKEYLFNSLPLLSINDISTIYVSAKNPKFLQSHELRKLIKSK